MEDMDQPVNRSPRIVFNQETGRIEVLSADGTPVELPPIIIDEHGHFGGLGAAISVADAISLGVAGNIAYQALVSAVGRYRKRIGRRSSNEMALHRKEVFDIAVGALRIANEICHHPCRLDTANVVLLNAAENASGDWNVVLDMRWDGGHSQSVWVDIPAGDITKVTIQVDGCEECRESRLRRHRR